MSLVLRERTGVAETHPVVHLGNLETAYEYFSALRPSLSNRRGVLSLRSYAVLALASGMHSFIPPPSLSLKFRKDSDTTSIIVRELRRLANNNLQIWSALEIVYSAALPVLPHHGLFHTRLAHLDDGALSVVPQLVVIDASPHDISGFRVVRSSNLVVLDLSNSPNFTAEDMNILTSTGQQSQLQVLLVRNCTSIGQSAVWRAAQTFIKLKALGHLFSPQ